jgi:predicted  nucleic acid-binding Zn-ribbon protein
LLSAEAEIDAEVSALTARRADLSAALDGARLADYERRRRHHGGVAVATLDGRRCRGCNLDLSTSELEQVKALAPGELADCPQCGRLLVP